MSSLLGWLTLRRSKRALAVKPAVRKVDKALAVLVQVAREAVLVQEQEPALLAQVQEPPVRQRVQPESPASVRQP